MFDESQNKKEPEDIFSGTDPESSPGMPQQNLPPTPAEQAAPQGGQAMEAVPTMPPSGGGSSKKLVVTAIIVVVVVITLIAVLVGLWVVRRGQAPQTVPATSEAPSVQDAIEAADTNGEAMELDEDLKDLADEDIEAVIPVAPEPPADTDADGLTDEEELLLGTSITLPDTDNDGLNDAEEVRVWNTNPLVADTDGDGFSDGDEVKNGYDPTQVGGVLLDINQPGLGAN